MNGFLSYDIFGPGIDESRATKVDPQNPKDPSIVRMFGLHESSSGVVVDEETALSSTAVMRAVDLLSGHVGSIPLKVMERTQDGKRQIAYGHQAHRLLTKRPNAYMTPSEFKRTMQGWLTGWANAYAEIERTPNGNPTALWPIQPYRVTAKIRPDGEPYYIVNAPGGGAPVELSFMQMFHLKGRGDGLVGESNLTKAQDSIGLSIAMERYGAKFFSNGATHSGVYRHPSKMSDPAYNRLKESIANNHTGLSNAHRVMILEEGMDWTQTSADPEKSQLLDGRKFQVTEVSRITGIPPHKLFEMGRATWSNIEQAALEYYTDTLLIILTTWEEQCNLKLFAGDNRYYAKFNVNALLRADSETRGKFYELMQRTGAYSINRILELEDEEPFDDGDRRFVSVNLVPLDRVDDKFTAGSSSGDQNSEDPPQDDPNLVQRMITEASRPVILDAIQRMVRKERKAEGRWQDKDDYSERRAKYAETNDPLIRSAVEPSVRAFGDSLVAVLRPTGAVRWSESTVEDRTNRIIEDFRSLRSSGRLYQEDESILVDEMTNAAIEYVAAILGV